MELTISYKPYCAPATLWINFAAAVTGAILRENKIVNVDQLLVQAAKP